MKKKLIFTALLVLIFSGCSQIRNINEVTTPTDEAEFPPRMMILSNTVVANSGLNEYCFNITPKISIGAKKATQFPADFLRSDANILAAINGVYWDTDGTPLGEVFLADNNHLANKQGRISGYLLVNKAGTEIKVAESFDENYQNYYFVVGTHPILLINSQVHSQAAEERYNKYEDGRDKVSYRSAIGTKDGRNICFAVSANTLTMSDWADLLLKSGYRDALNLDGGPVSQLAIRENNEVKTSGAGLTPTHLIIFSYQR